MFLRTADWEPLAADPAVLVEALNLVFLQGQMLPATRTVLTNYAAGIPANAPASRVIETVDLLINSPHYAVQR